MTTKRLLLIHKNQTIGEIIQACLIDLVGGKVEVARSTLEGLRQGISYQPDAIFWIAIVNPLQPTMLALEIAKVLGWDLN